MKWVVDGLIEDGSCIVLAGEPKRSIKTWILCELIHAISSGRPAFGHFKTSEVMRPTFLLAIEDADASIRARVEAIAAGHQGGSDAVSGLPMWVRGRPVRIDIADRSQAEAIARRIADYSQKVGQAALVCIDTLARANRSANENSAQEMSVVWDNITLIRDMTGAAIVTTHHLNKPAGGGKDERGIGNRMRGSSAIWGATEGLLAVSPQSFKSNGTESLWTCRVTAVAKTGDAHPPFEVELYTKNGRDRRAKVAKWRVIG